MTKIEKHEVLNHTCRYCGEPAIISEGIGIWYCMECFEEKCLVKEVSYGIQKKARGEGRSKGVPKGK